MVNPKKLLGILLLFIVLLPFWGCKNKKADEIIIIPDAQKTHLQVSRLKGKIKIITTKSYFTQHKDSISDKTLKSIVIQQYSSDGYILKVVTLDQKNDTVRIRFVDYNGDVRQTKWTETDFANKIVSYSQFKYDMNGYISGEEYYSADTLVYSIQYKTDGLGGITEMLKNNKQFTLKNQLQYNEKGLLIRMDEYDPNGKLFKYVQYEYDNYGDEVNRKVFRGTKNMVEYTYTQYDLKGKLIKEIYQNMEHGLKEVKSYPSHDRTGNWTFEVFTANNDTIYFRKRDIIYY